MSGIARSVRPLAGLLVLTASPQASHAAVRVCAPSISSGILSAASELEAKKAAMEQWRREAAALGEGMDRWQLAANRVLKCFPKGGMFECMAIASPCVIQQNPQQQPAGKDRKGLPL